MQLRSRPDRQLIYSGRTLLVTDPFGGVRGEGAQGLYVDNTRVLSAGEVLVDGKPVRLFAAAPVSPSVLFGYAEAPASGAVPAEAVYLEITHELGRGLRTQVRVRSYHSEPVSFELGMRLGADFADVEEAQQQKRQQTAEIQAHWDPDQRAVTFRYLHPDLPRQSAVRVVGGPAPRFADGRLRFDVRLDPGEAVDVDLAVEAVFETAADTRHGRPRDIGAALEAVRTNLAREASTLSSSNHTVAAAWATAVRDLSSMPFGLPAGPAAPSAGYPLYQQFFGRDTLTISWQAALAGTTMLRDSLAANAALQGQRIDDWRDEEPGKLIHQAGFGPLSALGIHPFIRYYGDWATPCDFLIGLGQYLAWSGDLDTVRRLLPTARRVLQWLDRYGDLDGDGLLEYESRSEKGVENQGWKDSWDAIVDHRGDVIEAPIASCELQAYWYIGLRQATLAFLLAGDRLFAGRLLRQSRRLRERFDEAFWLPHEGFYALALGPDKKPISSISSNPGHLLAAGIVPRAKSRQVADRLMAPDMFSGWGVRTLSADHPSYNPFSYHRGSVWPVENATFALGLARYGHWDHLHRLAEGMFAASGLFAENRLPEALSGVPRDAAHPHPGIYPKSNEPQGWSASAIILTVQALLGLRPVGPGRLLLLDPHLPDWLPDLRLSGVQVGHAEVDIEARRRGAKTEARMIRRSGRLRAIRQPPPGQPIRSPLRRPLAALERSFE